VQDCKPSKKIARGSVGPTFADEKHQYAGSDVQKAPDRGDVQETPEEDFEDATERTRGPQRKGKQKCKTVSLKRKHPSGETPGMAYRDNIQDKTVY
jgi:hypothetical protein